MIDRESTFKNPDVVALLKNNFIPVAFDQWYHRQQRDEEGEFYRKIARQGPRDLNATTQGFYVADANGYLFGYNNNRSPDRILKIMKNALESFEPKASKPVSSTKRDKKFVREIPTGAVVIRVNAKVLGGYDPTDNQWQKIFQKAISRDNLWILKSELAEMAKGSIPDSLTKRIARFHLVDNTRGEPDMWSSNDIRQSKLTLKSDGSVVGSFRLKSGNGRRGFDCSIRGNIRFGKDAELTTFDLVAHGQHWGAGRYTPNAPKGKFPLAVAFRLADGSDVADQVPPQGTKGWLEGYWK